MMGGIGSVYNAWRHLVKRVLMGDELASLSVPAQLRQRNAFLPSPTRGRSMWSEALRPGTSEWIKSRWRGLHLKMNT